MLARDGGVPTVLVCKQEDQEFRAILKQKQTNKHKKRRSLGYLAMRNLQLPGGLHLYPEFALYLLVGTVKWGR